MQLLLCQKGIQVGLQQRVIDGPGNHLAFSAMRDPKGGCAGYRDQFALVEIDLDFALYSGIVQKALHFFCFGGRKDAVDDVLHFAGHGNIRLLGEEGLGHFLIAADPRGGTGELGAGMAEGVDRQRKIGGDDIYFSGQPVMAHHELKSVVVKSLAGGALEIAEDFDQHRRMRFPVSVPIGVGIRPGYERGGRGKHDGESFHSTIVNARKPDFSPRRRGDAEKMREKLAAGGKESRTWRNSSIARFSQHLCASAVKTAYGRITDLVLPRRLEENGNPYGRRDRFPLPHTQQAWPWRHGCSVSGGRYALGAPGGYQILHGGARGRA